MRQGKVQTTDDGVNVLVEHEDSSNRHYSHLDFKVLCEKMSDEEIDIEFSKLALTLKDKKSFLRKVSGLATSNCYSKDKFTFGDLFRYIKIK